MNILKASPNRASHLYHPPFGYDVTEDFHLIPIEEDLRELEDVKDMIEMKSISFRDAAMWLSSQCSRSITYEGLRKRLKRPVRLEEKPEEAEA